MLSKMGVYWICCSKKITVFVLIGVFLVHAETIYVSSSDGNDRGNDGFSEQSPLKTIQNALSKVSGAGDKILLKKGDWFHEEVKMTKSGVSGNPIVIGSYGTGPGKPLICGADSVKGWEQFRANIYRAKINFNAYHLYEGKKLMMHARHPNTGYFPMDGLEDKKVLLDSDNLNKPDAFFKGADAVVRSNDWTIERKRIVSSGAGKITLDSPTKYSGGKDYGYFIDKSLAFLDTPGEWYFDSAQSMVYIYSSTNPAGKTYLAMWRNEGIQIQWGTGYIRIENIAFAYQHQRAVYCSNRNPEIELISCDLFNIGGQAIELFGDKNVVRNCTVTDILNDGIQAGGKNSLVEFTKVKRIGLVTGYADPWGSQGVVIGESSTIRRCVVDSVGYLGITMAPDAIIRENIVSNSCLALNDGGGVAIPFEVTGVIAERNFISGSYGNREGVPADNSIRANGFYFGGNHNKNIVCRNNTIYNNRNNGIIAIDTYDSEISGNTVYNNNGELVFFDMEPGPMNNNNKVENNVFFCLDDDRDIIFSLSSENTYATYSGNYYCNPYNSTIAHEAYNNSGSRMYTAKTWIAARDPMGHESPYNGLPYKIIDTLSANLITNGTFDNGIASWAKINNGVEIMAANHPVLGKCLKLEYSGEHNGFAAQSDIEVKENTYYLVQFSIISDQPWHSSVGIDDNSWNDAFKRTFGHGAKKEDIKYVVRADRTLEKGRFKIGGDAKTWYIDDVSMYAVSVEKEDAKVRSVLLLNPTDKDSTIALNGNYIDLDGNPVPQTVTLSPWSSKIIITTDKEIASERIQNGLVNGGYKLRHIVKGNTIQITGSGLSKGRLFDLNGRMVKAWNRIVPGNALDISNVSPGVYVFVLENSTIPTPTTWKIVRK